MNSNCSDSRAANADRGPPESPAVVWLRWLANFGLSLSAVDCVLESRDERGSMCPFARLLQSRQKEG